jgi:hypothetical protein
MERTPVRLSANAQPSGFAISTVYLGEELESQGIQWVSVGMILMIISFWLLNWAFMIKTIVVSLFIDSRVKLS